MHDCADAMPDVFGYDNVRAWFADHYPDVNEATIRAHLIGLTLGGRAKHVQFARRSPVFRRIRRGVYTPIPTEERGESPGMDAPTDITRAARRRRSQGRRTAPKGSRNATSNATPPLPEDAAPDVVLLGSVGVRANVPAPAKEVFRDIAFQLRRLDAEGSGVAWFILSAEHGLVAPDEWMSPDARTLDDMAPDYGVAWAGWVVARLESLVGHVAGMPVHVDAPDALVQPLFVQLRKAGATVSSGHVGSPATRDTVHPAAPVAAQAVLTPSTPAAQHLFEGRDAVPASEVSSLPESPGLYGWLVDEDGARELSHRLMMSVPPGLVFVGQVGGWSWQSLADPVLSLRDHVERIQLHGHARASTFRMTLATVLRYHLHMTSLEDPRLTAWMLEHLSISVWPTDELGHLRELEQQVVTDLDPPLNVEHLTANEYRSRLSRMRGPVA